MYNHYKNSSKQMDGLGEVADAINDAVPDDEGSHLLSFKKFHGVRWSESTVLVLKSQVSNGMEWNVMVLTNPTTSITHLLPCDCLCMGLS